MIGESKNLMIRISPEEITLFHNRLPGVALEKAHLHSAGPFFLGHLYHSRKQAVLDLPVLVGVEVKNLHPALPVNRIHAKPGQILAIPDLDVKELM
jgi:hypothetical protein